MAENRTPDNLDETPLTFDEILEDKAYQIRRKPQKRKMSHSPLQPAVKPEVSAPAGGEYLPTPP